MISAPVHDQSHVAEVRRCAVDLAVRQGFRETDAGRLALVTTELATNILKHGSGGEMLLGEYDDGDGSGIELLALDKGRGMLNISACLEDGYSSAGTAGHGLGAVLRQSKLVDIASWPGLGTAVLARVGRSDRAATSANSAPTWAAVSVAKPGQEVCGDSFAVTEARGQLTMLVADGLGHGPEAADAAVEAVRLFHKLNGESVSGLLEAVHVGLRATRGAAVAILRLDETTDEVTYSGVGNIAGVLVGAAETRRMVSMAGTAGHNARKIQEFRYPFASGLIILHSDGLSANWAPDRYPGLANLHPALIAGVLYRDLSRGRDDATVVVAKR